VAIHLKKVMRVVRLFWGNQWEGVRDCARKKPRQRIMVEIYQRDMSGKEQKRNKKQHKQKFPYESTP